MNPFVSICKTQNRWSDHLFLQMGKLFTNKRDCLYLFSPLKGETNKQTNTPTR